MSKIKKRNLSIGVIIFIMLLCVTLFATLGGKGISASAASEPSLDSIIYTDSSAFQFTPINETECSVKLIDKTIKNVRVPQTAVINDKRYDVTDVVANGFASNTEMETVILPSVLRLNSAAFQNCKNLKLIYVPQVKNIGASAFALCPMLKDIIFPATVESVGASVFLLNSTKVHARFDAVQSSWATNWNSGNKNTIHDFNELDEEGNLWVQDLVYEQIQQTNPRTRTTNIITRLAPLQPFMEDINNGHIVIPASDMDIPSGAFTGLYQSFTIETSPNPINIWSTAFNTMTVLDGITINREVTYNCGFLDDESVMVFNTVDTPFITLPTPEKILPQMFFANTVKNINFKTAEGTNFEANGVVKIPSTIKEISYNAFEETKNIKHMYIPSSITKIGNEAFAGWDITQTIYMPFLSEAHANKILGTGWKTKNSANIDFEGDFSIVSQPDKIIDDSVYKMYIELKLKDKNELQQYSCASGVSYSGNQCLDFSTTIDKGITQKGDYWVRSWEKQMWLKNGSIGEMSGTPQVILYKNNIETLTISGESFNVPRFIRTAADFMKYTPDSYDYGISLLNDIDLGILDNNVFRGIKLVNYNNFYGNDHTITYAIKHSIIPARKRYNLTLFEENRATISNLKINANITVSNYEILIENNTQQGSTAKVGGIVLNNIKDAKIENCEVTINTNINAPNSDVAGIATENRGIIKNSVVKGNFTSTALEGMKTAGVAIYNWNGEISYCINQAKFDTYGNSGGIVAQNNSIISNCENTGTIIHNFVYTMDYYNAKYNRALGGIVGYNLGTVTNSKNSGIIKFGKSVSPNADHTLEPRMGQIIGIDDNGTKTNNTWTGSVITIGLQPYQTTYAKNEECGMIM